MACTSADTHTYTLHACCLNSVFSIQCICYTEKAPNAWQRQGTQKKRNTYNQPNRPNRQTSQTQHRALPKGQPGRRITPINTAAVHASAQQQPTVSTHTRQGHHQIFWSLCVLKVGAAKLCTTLSPCFMCRRSTWILMQSYRLPVRCGEVGERGGGGGGCKVAEGEVVRGAGACG